METTLRHLVTTLKYVTDRQALLIPSAQHFTLPALITTKYLKKPANNFIFILQEL